LSDAAMEGGIRNYANSSLSSLSLPLPGGVQGTDKRRLLLIYIHGFMGSEASFHEFPAHIHDLVTSLLSESHVVYTRIYPRYKSHGELQTAVTQFSAWYVLALSKETLERYALTTPFAGYRLMKPMT
jgi:esterase/lipase